MDTGIGLRHPHHADALACPRPTAAAAFVEVHSENFFGDGGAALQLLHAVRERWPVSLHGVGLALGSAAGLDPWHLERLARLVERIDPLRVSDHASFARAPLQPGAAPVHAADLLPCAFTEGALAILVDNVQRVQDRLRRPLLVENLSSYLRWGDDALAEPDFFAELARRSGCGVLLDVNNLVVNALNDHGGDEAAAVRDACRWIDRLPGAVVGEVHLAGYSQGDGLVIDDHASAVHAPVWQVYEHLLRRMGRKPTLIEWDQSLPSWERLLQEAACAERRLEGAAVEVAA
ncbi:MAG: DUF692 domain-containing protein [Rubrivivax sp.]